MPRWRNIADSIRWWFGLLAALWLVGAVALIVAPILRDDAGVPWLLLAYAGVTVVASLAAFALYGVDKRRAVKEGRRVPERVLHAAALCGGWPGAFFAQRVFRHKTQKTSFRLMFWLIVLLHAAAIGYGAWHWWNRPVNTATRIPTAALSSRGAAWVRLRGVG